MFTVVLQATQKYGLIDNQNCGLSLQCTVISQLTNDDPITVFGTKVESFQVALDIALEPMLEVQVFGSSTLLKSALNHHGCSRIIVTSILRDLPCKDCIPPIDTKKFELKYVGNVELDHQTLIYERRLDECQYLDLVRNVLDFGNDRMDRTGDGTLSIFGNTMKFNLRNGQFPLLTTKKVFIRGIVEELLFFVRGQTDANILHEKKVTIWDQDGAATNGDLGPIYSFQWRHFGACYVNCNTNYTGQGIDQLQNLIRDIRNTPNSRRMIMSAWNVSDIDKMALPPCHIMCQFYVFKNELSCAMYQRSGDLGLGVPFNIASYSLLTCLIAKVTGLQPGEFVHVLGDAHVYRSHIGALREQLSRAPVDGPTLKIITNKENVQDYEFSDFILSGYNPQAAVKMKMTFKEKESQIKRLKTDPHSGTAD